MNKSDTQTGKSTDDEGTTSTTTSNGRNSTDQLIPADAIDDHAATLKKAANAGAQKSSGGGGCLETAQAATDTRNRRTVLSGALAAIVSVGALPLSAGADSDSGNSDDAAGDTDIGPDDITVETPPAAEQARAEARALTNDDVQAIRTEFIGEGWTPAGDRVLRTEVHDDGTEFYTVVIEFSTPADEDATVLYNDHDGAASGLHAEHVDLSGDGENDHWELTSYSVSGGAVVTETDTIENFRGCSNVNWGCVAGIAGSYATMFGACAICSGSLTPPACAVCIGAVGGHLSLHTLCPWCHD
jgi:hypothetical protein